MHKKICANTFAQIENGKEARATINTELYATRAQLEAERAETETEIRKLTQQIKVLDYQEKKLTRSQRTHMLCTIGGILKNYLVYPELMTEEQVRNLLDTAFRQPEVQKLLNEYVREIEEMP